MSVALRNTARSSVSLQQQLPLGHGRGCLWYVSGIAEIKLGPCAVQRGHDRVRRVTDAMHAGPYWPRLVGRSSLCRFVSFAKHETGLRRILHIGRAEL